MGIFTHHVNDSNVIKIDDDFVFVDSKLETSDLMEVTKSGYLQPANHVRMNRFTIAFIVSWVLLFIRWQVSDSFSIDTYFDIFDTDTIINTVLVYAAFALWIVAAYIFLFQRAYLYGKIPGWALLNSTMMFTYFTIVGCITVGYGLFMIAEVLSWIGSLLRQTSITE